MYYITIAVLFVVVFVWLMSKIVSPRVTDKKRKNQINLVLVIVAILLVLGYRYLFMI